MPIYVYQCALCAFRTEVLQKSYESPAPICPKCKFMREGKTKVTSVMVRVVSRPNFSLKGSGWYRDGYGLRESSSEGTEQ